MKTAFEKMRSAEPYSFNDPDVYNSLVRCKELCARLNALTTSSPGFREVLTELIPGIPETALIVPPFMCDHGHGIRLGEHAFVNFGCTFLDGGLITIGRHTLVGPNCQIYTPTHPQNHLARREPVETALPVDIGDDCWLGGGVIVCPGVHIGPRCIIGAGSVVTHDIPADSLAAGNPARVIRRLA